MSAKRQNDEVIRLDSETDNWLAELSKRLNIPRHVIIESMLHDIRVDDEVMHAKFH